MAEIMAMVAQFHFLRPWWWLGLIPLVALYWLLRRERNAGGEWAKVIAPELLPFLVTRGQGAGVNLKPWVLAAGLLAITALAGPAWSKKAASVHRQEQPLIILFDLSPSMLASDIKPDRLTRARLKTIDLLNAYREGTAALIAYSGDAHVVTPLTDDTNTIITQLPVLHPAIMPSAGSNGEAAIAKAFELAANAGHKEGDLLLITDGVTPDARENMHALLRDHPGFRLSILGVGTDEGAPIPLNEQGFARDGQGSIVIARLGSGELRSLAEHAGGVYQGLTGTDADIQALLGPISSRFGGEARELERDVDIWEDQGVWITLLLLPLGALLFRRELFLCLLILPVVHSPETQASFWSDLWWTRDQQGARALEEGRAEEARVLFEDSQWKGIAAHRAGDHRAAAQAFAESSSADSHYNRGNALAQAGKLDEAIAAYDEALKRQPDMEDAIFNRSLVEAMKKQQQQQQGQNGKPRNPENGQDAGNPDSAGGPQDEEQAQPEASSGENTGASPPDTGGDDSAQQDAHSSSNGDMQEQPANASPEHTPQASGETPEPAAASPGEKSQADESQTSLADEGSASDHLNKEHLDEERQNAEQWLRRVPDDPGGLLRNKFEFEARQRFREESSNPRLPPGSYSEERW